MDRTTRYGGAWWVAALLIALATLSPVQPAAAGPPKRVSRPAPFFPLDLVWSRDMKEVIVDGAATDGSHVFVALRSGTVHALDTMTGVSVWAVAQAATAPLATGDGLVFVQLEDALVADDAQDGTPRWSLPLDGPLSAPVTFESGWLFVPTASGDLLALRPADGQPIWRRSLGSPVRGRPAGAGPRLFVALEDGRLVALDLATGHPLWSQSLGGTLSDPSAAGERVYVGSTTNMFFAINASNGRIDWKWRAGGDVAGPSPADADRIYFVSLDNVLRAVSRGNGNQQWRRDVPTRPAGGPLLAGHTVIVAGVAPELDGFKVEDGTAAGQYKAAGEFAGPPLLRLPVRPKEPAVVLVSRDGAIVALMPEPPMPVADPVLVPPPFDMPPFSVIDPPLVPLGTPPGTPLPPESEVAGRGISADTAGQRGVMRAAATSRA